MLDVSAGLCGDLRQLRFLLGREVDLHPFEDNWKAGRGASRVGTGPAKLGRADRLPLRRLLQGAELVQQSRVLIHSLENFFPAESRYLCRCGRGC